jgi:hypothetical protein
VKSFTYLTIFHFINFFFIILVLNPILPGLLDIGGNSSVTILLDIGGNSSVTILLDIGGKLLSNELICCFRSFYKNNTIVLINGCFHNGPVRCPRLVIMAQGRLYWPEATPRVNTTFRGPLWPNRGHIVPVNYENTHFLILLLTSQLQF